MVKECKNISTDFTELVKLGEVFSNPFSLVWNIDKNMIVNGVDIFEKIMKAISYYKAGDYYNFGKYIGESLAELLLSTSTTALQTKDANDAQAYDFMNGYFQYMKLEGFNQQDLYNKIDEIHEECLGEKMIAPLHEALMVLEEEQNFNPRVW